MRWWHLLFCVLDLHEYRVVYVGFWQTRTGYALVCPWCGDVKG